MATSTMFVNPCTAATAAESIEGADVSIEVSDVTDEVVDAAVEAAVHIEADEIIEEAVAESRGGLHGGSEAGDEGLHAKLLTAEVEVEVVLRISRSLQEPRDATLEVQTASTLSSPLTGVFSVPFAR
ncbi:hypothetical protein PHYPSEUDO_000985 [Phytophthora pseudosyringae]|uniref:Uncharacterized protein n=1 Tax=Phytophthora pseudosyringae TaxID=221518 RepID=A0A8T1V608_9STRA|nr:hypothetical protein PHYPSEUDO_000985 [Phytophthora pseudosyringae]